MAIGVACGGARMNWDAVSAIGQVVGALFVGVTLVYLALQLRQNTAALRASTFLAISSSMGATMEVLATHADLAPLIIKAQSGLDALSDADKVRFGFLMMMTYRRLETVVIQRHLGFIDLDLTEGFERSALSALASTGARQWWEGAKSAFSTIFVTWVDGKISAGVPQGIHAGLGLGVSDGRGLA
jgi:hypothetical protein